MFTVQQVRPAGRTQKKRAGLHRRVGITGEPKERAALRLVGLGLGGGSGLGGGLGVLLRLRGLGLLRLGGLPALRLLVAGVIGLHEFDERELRRVADALRAELVNAGVAAVAVRELLVSFVE